MTRDRTFKSRVRDRMRKTGERYTTARRQLLATMPATRAGTAGDGTAGAGVHSATAAFRTLLAHAGHDVPESTLLAIGGGVGIGVFAFHYAEFSSLFLAGRHLWHDDLAFLQGLAGRLGTTLEVRETGGRKRAEADLLEMVAEGPAVAFVDLGTLGHRGGVEAYYVVVVHDVDPDAGVARIGDLATAAVEVPLATLADARAKHRKFKNRLVRPARVPPTLPLADATRAGLRAGRGGLRDPAAKGTNFRLDALDTLAARMRGDGKEGWAATFPPGPRLWTALASFYEYVEHYGTGGGLMRPCFAQALREAGERLGLDTADAAAAYDAAGEGWSAAAQTALPDEVDDLAAMKGLIDDVYATYDALGPDAPRELDDLRARRADLRRRPFPLDAADARGLAERLADQVDEVAARERRALAELEALPL